jgi:hypothetical protein
LGPGWQMRDGCQQEVVSGRRSERGLVRPERFQQVPDAGLLSRGPEGGGQAKLAGGGGQGDGAVSSLISEKKTPAPVGAGVEVAAKFA